MKFNWKRFAWVLFVCLYSALFFYNCLRPFGNWVMPYIYTMVLIIWLAYEYYQKNIFFQSGFIPDTVYFWLPRALFALFFYSALVIGIATIIWWPRNQIGLYPFINLVGLIILALSIYRRQVVSRKKTVNHNASRDFYLSVALLIASLALGYGSLFLIGYVIVIGLPLIYWNHEHERRVLARFTEYIEQQGVTGSKQIDYAKQWEQYLARKTAKAKNK
ncbi:MAG: hypothetical protein PVI51_00710 [candidate division WOR-3 bacterium]